MAKLTIAQITASLLPERNQIDLSTLDPIDRLMVEAEIAEREKLEEEKKEVLVSLIKTCRTEGENLLTEMRKAQAEYQSKVAKLQTFQLAEAYWKEARNPFPLFVAMEDGTEFKTALCEVLKVEAPADTDEIYKVPEEFVKNWKENQKPKT